jgi:DNA-binding FrmR family transcriptional regulator
MIDAETKKTIRARLRRIAGQVQAVERMVDTDRYCIDVMHQLAAAQAAIGMAGEVIVRSHVEAFVADPIQSGNPRDQWRRVEALMAIVGRYRRICQY